MPEIERSRPPLRPSMIAAPGIRLALKRGLCRKCPRCGEGPLFRGLAIRERCSSCDLIFPPDYGDIWLFMVFTARLPILLGIALFYFGFRSADLGRAAIFFVLLAIPVLGTIRERQGLALALDYLTRRM